MIFTTRIGFMYVPCVWGYLNFPTAINMKVLSVTNMCIPIHAHCFSEVLLVRLGLSHRNFMLGSVTHLAVMYAFTLTISSTSVFVFPDKSEKHFHLQVCVCHATLK